MPSKLTLYDATKVSYESRKQAKREMKKKGYYLDKKLSHGHEKVFYNPYDKKLLMTVPGSSSKYDWIVNDPLLGAGKIHHTDRYKEAHERLIAAKKKYGINATVVGHSLGGGIASSIGGEKDNIYTYNKGVAFFNRNRSNETHYRTTGDIVSSFAADPRHNINLKNANDPNALGTAENILYHGLEGFHGALNGSIKTVYNAGYAIAKDLYDAHSPENLKNENIFI